MTRETVDRVVKDMWVEFRDAFDDEADSLRATFQRNVVDPLIEAYSKDALATLRKRLFEIINFAFDNVPPEEYKHYFSVACKYEDIPQARQLREQTALDIVGKRTLERGDTLYHFTTEAPGQPDWSARAGLFHTSDSTNQLELLGLEPVRDRLFLYVCRVITPGLLEQTVPASLLLQDLPDARDVLLKAQYAEEKLSPTYKALTSQPVAIKEIKGIE